MAEAALESRRANKQKYQGKEGRKTEQDWLDQEAAEKPGKVSLADPYDDLVGTDYKIIHAGYDHWIDPRTGGRFVCSRYYPHLKLVIDFPDSQEEADGRALCFKALNIAYVYVTPVKPKPMIVVAREIEEAIASCKIQSVSPAPKPDKAKTKKKKAGKR